MKYPSQSSTAPSNKEVKILPPATKKNYVQVSDSPWNIGIVWAIRNDTSAIVKCYQQFDGHTDLTDAVSKQSRTTMSKYIRDVANMDFSRYAQRIFEWKTLLQRSSGSESCLKLASGRSIDFSINWESNDECNIPTKVWKYWEIMYRNSMFKYVIMYCRAVLNKGIFNLNFLYLTTLYDCNLLFARP